MEPSVITRVGEGLSAGRDSATQYDPRYDPLVSPGPGHGKQYAPTY